MFGPSTTPGHLHYPTEDDTIKLKHDHHHHHDYKGSN
jgi:hypothetical protein